jgi:hypothetical protein
VPPGVGHNVTSVTGLAGIVPGADFRQTIRTPVGRLFFPATGLTTLAEPSLTGGCLCGGVRFELTEPAPAAGYCHCTRCQRRTGTAASAQARIDGHTFRLVRGTELVKASPARRRCAGSGRRRTRGLRRSMRALRARW